MAQSPWCEPGVEPCGHLLDQMSQVGGRRVAMTLAGVPNEPHGLAESIQCREQLLALLDRGRVVHVARDDEHRCRDCVGARDRTRLAVEVPVPIRRRTEMTLSALGPAGCPEPFVGIV